VSAARCEAGLIEISELNARQPRLSQINALVVQIVDRDPVKRRFMTVPGTCPAGLNTEILAPNGHFSR
jgi:hypothetical protein